jgi:predicted CoA-binding protein
VDIVNIYRPEQEHEEIISNHALPLNAKVLWLHPPVTSEKTRSLAARHGLTFVEGIAINEAALK